MCGTSTVCRMRLSGIREEVRAAPRLHPHSYAARRLQRKRLESYDILLQCGDATGGIKEDMLDDEGGGSYIQLGIFCHTFIGALLRADRLSK